MISLPSAESLQPQRHCLTNGSTLYVFPSTSTELVKLDFLTESGSVYQPQPLCAAAANRLFYAAGGSWSAAELSEFFDYRGILVDNNTTVFQSSASFYTLVRHLDDLFPVLDTLLHQPAFPEQELAVYLNKKRQEIANGKRKSADVARKLYYEALFGADHPMGRHAEPEDADRLGLETVRSYYAERHRVGDTRIVLSGHVDDRLLSTVDRLFGHDAPTPGLSRLNLEGAPLLPPARRCEAIDEAVQTTIRVGRRLNLRWDDPDYASLMLLITALGGYFGSRLMSNLREDKGYTYGIYAHTQIFRGAIVFYITTDVAGAEADNAEREIMHELQRLVDEPLSNEELDLVRTVFVGDFLRSVDGIFERSTRFCDMLGTDIDERFTENLRAALSTVTPADLQRLAVEHLRPEMMTVCRAGAV